MTVRDLLNERKWRHGDLDRVDVIVRHRGAENDERRILGTEIREIRGEGLIVSPLDPDSPDVFIPWHRVLRILAPEGTIWPPAPTQP